MILGERIGEATHGADSKLYSPYPFSNGGRVAHVPDAFEGKAWEVLSEKPGQVYFEFIEAGAEAALRYATADVMRPECVACHNSHPASPKTDWQVGDVRGVLEITLPLTGITVQTHDKLNRVASIYIVIGLGMLIVCAMVITRLRRHSAELAHEVDKRTAALNAEIEERRYAMQALAQTEERFRVGIEASPAAMIMLDEQGRIAHVNHEAERMFDYPHGQLIGEAVELLMPEHERDAHPRHRASFLDSPSARLMGGRDLSTRKRTGGIFPVEIGLNPIETPEGKLVLCSVVDLTQRKQYEATILEQARALEEKNKRLHEKVVLDGLTPSPS